MTSYFLFYFKKVVYTITYSLALLAFLYYGSIGKIILFSILLFLFLLYYYFYSSRQVINQFKGFLIQGQDPYLLNEKVLKFSKSLDIIPPKIYLSKLNYPLLSTYFVSKNNAQIFISDKLLINSTTNLIEAYLFLALSQIQTKHSKKNSFAYLITNITLRFTRQLDFLFSWVFGIHADLKYIYRSPFSYLFAMFLYSLNFLFLTEKNTQASDTTASLNGQSSHIAKALWNLQHYGLNISYPLVAPSSILCVVNPLENKYWLRFLHYQTNIKDRVTNIKKHYPVF